MVCGHHQYASSNSGFAFIYQVQRTLQGIYRMAPVWLAFCLVYSTRAKKRKNGGHPMICQGKKQGSLDSPWLCDLEPSVRIVLHIFFLVLSANLGFTGSQAAGVCGFRHAGDKGRAESAAQGKGQKYRKKHFTRQVKAVFRPNPYSAWRLAFF
jgi:hypothetical protein